MMFESVLITAFTSTDYYINAIQRHLPSFNIINFVVVKYSVVIKLRMVVLLGVIIWEVFNH